MLDIRPYHMLIPATLICLLIPALPSSHAGMEYRQIQFFTMEVDSTPDRGFEPHIVVGPGPQGHGEWFYIDSPNGLGSGQSGNLWISDDGGYTWEYKEKQVGNIGGSGDSYTAISKDGTIFYTDLYGATVTCDVSTDGGDTWFQNPVASTYHVLDDRQWFAIGPTPNPPPGSKDETLYLIYNSWDGLILQRSRYDPVGFTWETANAGLPISTNTRARDLIAVDPLDGTIYLPNTEGDGLHIYVSNDGGDTFQEYVVLETSEDIQNIFVVADVDLGGNVYLTWSTQSHIYLARSTDRGQNWKIMQVTETEGTRVFPWVTAGDPGRVALTWYETEEVGNSNELENATWGVYAAICTDALSENATFIITPIMDYVHTGTISTQGFGSTADRDLGDFFTCDIDQYGRLVVTFGYDGDDGVNARQSKVWFGKQIEGPYLYEDTGPLAFFTYVTDGLTVKFDASDTQDRTGGGLEYQWNFGDGSNATGVKVRHTYEKVGSYVVVLRVVDSEGLIDIYSAIIEVREKPRVGYPVVLIAGLLVLIVLLLAGSWVLKMRKKRAKRPPEREKVEVLPEETIPEGDVEEGSLQVRKEAGNDGQTSDMDAPDVGPKAPS